jgi:hypothetical protein
VLAGWIQVTYTDDLPAKKNKKKLGKVSALALCRVPEMQQMLLFRNLRLGKFGQPLQRAQVVMEGLLT